MSPTDPLLAGEPHRAVAPGASGRTLTVKTVVTGPFAAGKTALVSHLSETPVVATEAAVLENTRIAKDSTTVSMDYGSLTVEEAGLAVELLLFGTPGQGRFEFMWDVLATGMVGFVLLVDVSEPATWTDARRILTRFRGLAPAPYVVGANRAGEASPAAVDDLRRALDCPPDVPIVPCEVVERSSAKDLVLALLVEVLAHVEGRRPTGTAHGDDDRAAEARRKG